VIWTELADSIQSFLFYEDRKGIPQVSPEIVQRDEAIDISFADLISRVLLPSSSKVPLMHERFIDVLNEGTLVLAKSSRERFAEGCYQNLFYLCAQGGKPEDTYSCHMAISKLVAPLLMNRCREVLHRFVIEDKKSGHFPMARSKLAEVCFVLKQLQTLELHPDIPDEPSKSHLQTGRKRHLLKLFPLLCDCITTKEAEVKELLKDVFHEAAKELGIE